MKPEDLRYRALMLGVSVEEALSEEEGVLDKLSNFIFGRGPLAKAAGTDTKTPSTSTTAPPAEYSSTSIAKLAQQQADQSLKKPSSQVRPATSSATRPATEARSQIGLAKASSLTKSLRTFSSSKASNTMPKLTTEASRMISAVLSGSSVDEVLASSKL
jgi:hypothetical protein